MPLRYASVLISCSFEALETLMQRTAQVELGGMFQQPPTLPMLRQSAAILESAIGQLASAHVKPPSLVRHAKEVSLHPRST